MKAVILTLFGLGAIVFALLETRARRAGSAIPRFGDLVGFVLSYEVGRVPVGRLAVLGFWWWLGWHFLAR